MPNECLRVIRNCNSLAALLQEESLFQIENKVHESH